MKSLHLRAHVDSQGQVTLTLPPEVADQEVELLVVFETVGGDQRPAAWPPGLYAATAGAWQGEPLHREQEGSFEQRIELE
jgi:hypothetical protein